MPALNTILQAHFYDQPHCTIAILGMPIDFNYFLRRGSYRLILSQSSAAWLRFAAKNSPINARAAPSLYCVAFCARLPAADSAP